VVEEPQVFWDHHDRCDHSGSVEADLGYKDDLDLMLRSLYQLTCTCGPKGIRTPDLLAAS
jgi:hypothetical protein